MATITCETVQTSISEPEKKPTKSEHEPRLSHNGATCTGDSFVDETGWTEDFMKDIAKELDEWDSDTITTEPQQSHHQHCVHDRKHHHNNSIAHKARSTDGGNLPIVAKFCQLQETGSLTEQSNSVPDCVSHVTPISVLPSGKDNSTLTPVFTHSLTFVKMSASHTSPSGNVSEVSVVKETPPFVTKCCIDHQIQEKYQSCQRSSLTDHQQLESFNTPQASPIGSFTHTKQNRTVSFRTPSTAEWMKAKRLSSHSTHTPVNFGTSVGSTHTPPNLNSGFAGGVLLSGGKVTPPLCECGKRTKRRTVSNPGPNEGKTFYACPNGKASDKSHGCGFFKWEMMLAGNCSPHSHASSRSYTKLESEYPESNK